MGKKAVIYITGRKSASASASAPSSTWTSASSSTSSISESSWPHLVLSSLCFNGHYITRQQFRRLKDLFSHQSGIDLFGLDGHCIARRQFTRLKYWFSLQSSINKIGSPFHQEIFWIRLTNNPTQAESFKDKRPLTKYFPNLIFKQICWHFL